MQVHKCEHITKERKKQLEEASKTTSALRKAHEESNKAVTAHQAAAEDAVRAKKAAEKARCSAEASQKVTIILHACQWPHPCCTTWACLMLPLLYTLLFEMYDVIYWGCHSVYRLLAFNWTSLANAWFRPMQVKMQQLAHHEQQKKAAKVQVKVQERELSDEEGELRRLRGSLEPLKTLWCATLLPHEAS
jgi:hypothetical protein